jgi:hypothetical protein
VHVTLLAHERAQGIEFAGVTAIQRRQGRNGGEIHPLIVIATPGKPNATDCRRQACPHLRKGMHKTAKTRFGFT